jgi:hypothetical protein
MKVHIDVIRYGGKEAANKLLGNYDLAIGMEVR